MNIRYRFILLALFCLCFFSIGNWVLPITDPVESNYALTAKEMLSHHNFISPQIYGIYWYDKPIFIYWLLYISYALFGITDFAARFPSALFSTATIILVTWYILYRSQHWLHALIMAAMLATSLEFWAIGHSVVTDQPLFFFTTATLLFAYIGLTENKKKYIIVAYIMSAGAVLTKGPVGFLLPGLFLFIFCLMRKNITYFKRLFPWQGIALFLVCVLSWYAPMYVLHSHNFIDGFFLLNNITRATVSEHPEINVWYYYLLLLPLTLLPWTGISLYGWFKQRKKDDEFIFMSIWWIGTILFYSCMATKYPTYSYIAIMPLLYYGASTIYSWLSTGGKKISYLLILPPIIYWVILAIVSVIYTPKDFTLPSLLPFALFLLAAIFILCIAHYKKAYPAIPTLITLLMLCTYITLTFQVLAPYYTYRSTNTLQSISDLIPRHRVYFYHNYQTSFVYYTDEISTLITTDKPPTSSVHAVWNKKYLYPKEKELHVLSRIQQGEKIVCIVHKKNLKDFQQSTLYPHVYLKKTIHNYSIYVTN